MQHSSSSFARAARVMLWVVLACGWSARASAQAPTYAELMRDAEQEYQAGQYVDARVLYRKAYALHPDAASLIGVAECAMAIGEYAEAAQVSRLALTSKTAPPTAQEQQKLNATLLRARPFVGEYLVQVVPGNAELAIDGQPVQLTSDHVLVLAPGPHTVHALAEGYVPAAQQIETRAGVRTTLDVILERPAGGLMVYDDEDDEDEEADEGEGVSAVPIILVSVGVATLIAGGITALVALDNEGDLEDRCGDDPQFCPKHNSALAHSAEDLAVATNVLWVTGGLITAVGTTWLVLELTDDDEEEAPTAALRLGPTSVQLNGTF